MRLGRPMLGDIMAMLWAVQQQSAGKVMNATTGQIKRLISKHKRRATCPRS